MVHWNKTWALAVVFGLTSIVWVYTFVEIMQIPLWPSFIAAATFYAAGGKGKGFVQGYTGNLTGIIYALATLLIVGAGSGRSVVLLSVVVGIFMFLGVLHKFLPLLKFTPATFFGYATMFGVHSMGASIFGLTELAGASIAAAVSMFIGALIGYGTERASLYLSGR